MKKLGSVSYNRVRTPLAASAVPDASSRHSRKLSRPLMSWAEKGIKGTGAPQSSRHSEVQAPHELGREENQGHRSRRERAVEHHARAHETLLQRMCCKNVVAN
jgi:hypothetical protein